MEVPVVVLHDEEARVGEVVHVQELASGRPGAPDDDLTPPIGLRVVELADQRRQYMGVLQVKIVSGPI